MFIPYFKDDSVELEEGSGDGYTKGFHIGRRNSRFTGLGLAEGRFGNRNVSSVGGGWIGSSKRTTELHKEAPNRVG